MPISIFSSPAPTVAIFLGLICLPQAFAEGKRSQDGFCTADANKYLAELGMGSFGRPAKDVGALTDSKSVSFTRDGGEVGTSVVVQKLFSGSQQRVSVRVPSVLFPPYEEKAIGLNDRCQVTSVEMIAGGTAVRLNAKQCRDILKAHRALAAKRGGNELVELSLKSEFPKHGWAKCDNVYSSGVVALCQEHEADFAKDYSKGSEGSRDAGSGLKSGASAE